MSHRSFQRIGLVGLFVAGCALPRIDADYTGAAGKTGDGTGGNSSNSQGGNAGNNSEANAGTPGATTQGGITSSSGRAGKNSGGNASAGTAGRSSGSAGAAAGSVPGSAGAINSGGTAGAGGTSSTGSSSANGGVVSSAGGVTATRGGSANGGVGTGGSANGGVGTGGSANGGVGAGGSAAAAGTANVAGAAGAAVVPVPKSVTTGWYHSCALMSDGTVRCWGSEYCGALGNGNGAGIPCDPFNVVDQDIYDGTKQTKPVKVNGVTNAVQLSAAKGGFHNCVVESSGGVSCWGYNGYGQLGDGFTQTVSTTAVSVQFINSAVSVAVGYESTCALLKDSTVTCWGANSLGQLGNNATQDSALPVAVMANGAGGLTALTDVASISAGWWHTCAILKTDNSVWCWGANSYGQLGLGTVVDSSVAKKTGFVDAAEVSCGGEFTCIRDHQNAVTCAGANADGELANGNTSTTLALTAVTLAAPASTLASGGYHACAVVDGGSTARALQCWGYNNFGQLGIGNLATSLNPVKITGFDNVTQVDADVNHTCALSNGAVYCWGSGIGGQLGLGNTSNVTIPKVVLGL